MWAVSYLDDAARKFKKLDPALQRRIKVAITELSTLDDPAARGKPLQYGHKGHWRLRVGSFRVIYRLDGHHLIIVVVDMGARDNVYD